MQVVKGISRRVIIVESPDPRIFEKAIFFVRPDISFDGLTGEDILKEAQRTADTYIRHHIGKRRGKRLHLPAPLYAAAGAAATAAAWIASMMIK